jgi:hypothetical protein
MSISTDLEQRLRVVLPGAARTDPTATPLTDYKHYGTVARRLIDDRIDREKTFGIEICQDLAWNMMLDVYVSMTDGRRVSDVALALASGAPASTATRMINFMIANGDFVRTMRPNDRISTAIALGEARFAAITAYLARVAERCGIAVYGSPAPAGRHV